MTDFLMTLYFLYGLYWTGKNGGNISDGEPTSVLIFEMALTVLLWPFFAGLKRRNK